MSKGMSSLVERLGEIGFERTRRAVAALALSLFVSLFLLVALNVPPELRAAFFALSGCYLVAFLAVAAEWFWGRWFAAGLGWSGLMVAIASMVMVGWVPPLAIYGGLHLLIVVSLAGKKMAARYDLQEAWRQRYRMDDLGVARLRKTVTSASASLPSLILWALGPKTEVALVGSLVAIVLTVAGLRGVVRMRSWGILALGGAGALVATLGHIGGFATDGLGDLGLVPNLAELAGPTLAFACLAVAVIPFVRPAVRFLRRPS